METVFELIIDSLIDIIRMLPFLFIAYYCMEKLEHSDKFFLKNYLLKARGFAPLIGSLVGIFPQCGFGVVASALYVNHSITIGTLLAVFISTSDEAIPILLANPDQLETLFRIILLKIMVGCISGYLLDFMMRFRKQKSISNAQIIHEHCHDKNESILVLAIVRTLKMALFLFAISICLQIIMNYYLSVQVIELLQTVPMLQIILAALIGFIPSCAASILLSQAYMSGIIGFAALFAGLVTSSGIGYLVLWKLNKNVKEVLLITFCLLLSACISGILLL